ncbi:unnamed protein product [Menidia menidia]|uniref:(Atlantic silverside) hypothetical protein n=1 Tax=Menidia menidia TaxID=238744 RepID=A0A8S4BNS9_9TELE|nr:unnamed protein product [Menidia menidia]
MKPPISRAKMMSVTKSAIKAIKLYKHVVQIVEKFIKKCKPELKVPGLYVVDSIVRQSRHQFGVEKDVFGPRFLKNFTDTFQNLYRCPEDDKTKIVRVLNLWQKNGVFDLDIIQPLMSMADGVSALPPTLEVPVDLQPKTQPPVSNASVGSALPKLPSPDALAAVAQLFQSPHGQELQRMLKNFQQADKTLAASNSLNPPQRPGAQPNAYCEQTEKKNSLAEDRSEREKDRERRQRGLPSIKSQTLSVCSTTLWVGQLDKKTQQSDVMSLLEEFGQIESINIAWALNKGIKSAHKKFWDVERGVTYIPWNKVKVEELDSFREGGMLDAESLNPGKSIFILLIYCIL